MASLGQDLRGELGRLLEKAAQEYASDIHFELWGECFRVRYRVDGVLKEICHFPMALARQMVSLIKTMAGLNTSEVRLPQEGIILKDIQHKLVEFRVSTLPAVGGESVVLRVLQNDPFTFDTLFADHPSLRSFLENVVSCPGLTLFVGPTGCGKSTTVYSVLRKHADASIKILTCEDPVEQRIPYVTQSSIEEGRGWTFERALRAFLRNDPDMIFVGEIRDAATAALAVRAAITGHTLLATLHAKGAMGAVFRLIDLGVSPTLVSLAIRAVITQELWPQPSGKGRQARFDFHVFSQKERETIAAIEKTRKFKKNFPKNSF